MRKRLDRVEDSLQGLQQLSESTAGESGRPLSREAGPGSLRDGASAGRLPPEEQATSEAVREVVLDGSLPERRRRTRYPRISWAADRPFTGSRSGLDQPAGLFQPNARRVRWERRALSRAVAGDAVAAAVVVIGLLASLDRPDLSHWVAVIAVGWPLIVAGCGGYQGRTMGAGPEEFQSVLRAGVALVAFLGVGAFLTQTLLPTRWLLVGAPALCLFTASWHYLVRQWLHRARRRGQACLRTLVVGGRKQVAPVVRDLTRSPHHGYLVIGGCAPDITAAEQIASGIPKLGSISDIPQVVVDHDVDVVIITGSDLSGIALRRLSWALERSGADLVVAPGLVEVAGPHVSLRPTAGLSLVHLEIPSRKRGTGIGKALLDRIGGTVMLLTALPVILGCAFMVKLTSPGPAFFRQTRAGVDGRPFTMWKLRSMVVDAEARKTALLELNESDGALFKMKHDPRVTSVGALLRRFSLDELPQLWNVVKGDMSLVGPRPPLLSETEQYVDAVHRRLRVKPGLTGLWQVSGRSDLSWNEAVSLDLRYVDNWSVAMDLLILWKTARVVFRGSGAY